MNLIQLESASSHENQVGFYFKLTTKFNKKNFILKSDNQFWQNNCMKKNLPFMTQLVIIFELFQLTYGKIM